MSIPKFFEFLGPTLELLTDGTIHNINSIRSKVADKMRITEDDRRIMLPSGKQATYANRITWAVVYLKKAGLIQTVSRGNYRATQDGINTFQKVGIKLNLQDLEKSKEFVKFRYGTNDENENHQLPTQTLLSIDITPEDSMEKAHNEMTTMLSDELLNAIMERSPRFFERLVVELLVKMGYGGAFEESGSVIGKTNDEGIDGVIREDKLGFSSIYIQAKRWDPESTVSRPEIQKFVGALAGQAATKGLFITTASFSKEAKNYANNRAYNTKVVLVDGKALAKLMIENGVGVSTVNTYEIKKIDSDYFSEDNEL